MGADDNFYSADLSLLLCAVAGKGHLSHAASCCFSGLKHRIVVLGL